MYYKAEYGLKQYYPIKFQINTFLKTYTHECDPIVPYLDFKKLLHA